MNFVTKSLTLIGLICLSFLSFDVQAQLGYKRYPTLEHFTNTRCGSCAASNPALFTYLSGFAGQYHHMSIHPSIPYNNCVFYLHNTTENNARKDYYGLAATPTMFMNGTLSGLGSIMLPAAKFSDALALKSPIGVQVIETGTTSRNVEVKVHTAGAAPAGTYVLRVAVLEKQVNYNAPNGETVHHNVFRKFLTPVAGAPITLAANAAFVSSTYQYAMDPAWKESEIYVIAFVQNTVTKEILNSGTRYDNFVLDAKETELTADIKIWPNPATHAIQIESAMEVQEISAYNALGQLVYNQTTDQRVIDISAWKSGIYTLLVHTKAGKKATRLVID